MQSIPGSVMESRFPMGSSGVGSSSFQDKLSPLTGFGHIFWDKRTMESLSFPSSQPPPIDTKDFSHVVGGTMHCQGQAMRNARLVPSVPSIFDIAGLASSKYHIGVQGMPELTIDFIHSCSYTSFSPKLPDQILVTGFDPVWYSILRDCVKNYLVSVYFLTQATMKSDTSIPKKLILSPMKGHLPLTPPPCWAHVNPCFE